MWAAADAVGPVVIVGRRLQRLGRAVAGRMRGYRRLGVWRAEVGQSGRRRRRSAGTGLGEVSAYMRWDRTVARVVIARPMQVQRGKLARRGNCRVLRRRRRRMDGSMVREKRFARPPRSLPILPQIGLRLGGCLLNGACVVVLMARQSGAASERFLAVRVWAFVGTLARVDSAVPSQGRRVTEGLTGSARLPNSGKYIPCRISRTCGVSRLYGRGNARSRRSAG